MTNNKAIEILNALAWVQGGPDREETITAISMAIEALNQTAWIPVEERLPENGFDDIVLVSIGYDMEFGRCNSNGEWLIWSSGWIHCDKVLAWMPLPEPYKGSKLVEVKPAAWIPSPAVRRR